MYAARLRGAPVGVPPPLALHAAARASSAAPGGGVDWSSVGGPRRVPPGPAARLGLVPEAFSFLSRPEVRGDVDCHGNSFVAPAPTEAEAEKDDGDGECAAADIFPPHATHMERERASFVADQRRGVTAGFAAATSHLTAVLNTGALAMPAGAEAVTPPARPARAWADMFRQPAPGVTSELGGSAVPDSVSGMTDTLVHLLDPTVGFNVPVVALFRAGKVANHVESVYGHSADKVRKYPGHSKMKADRYYIVSHGRGPRFVITSHYALALFGRDEVSGSSPGPHLEKVGSWDGAVAVLRQRALAWRDSAATRHTYGTPGGGVAIAARTPASAATTFSGEADSDD